MPRTWQPPTRRSPGPAPCRCTTPTSPASPTRSGYRYPPTWPRPPQAAPADAASAEAPATVLILLDRARATLAAVGPFDDPAAADAWRPTPDPGSHADTAIDQLVIGLHRTLHRHAVPVQRGQEP
jgi:hypothetical protein